jgi:minor extracellular serine protease Vpr
MCLRAALPLRLSAVLLCLSVVVSGSPAPAGPFVSATRVRLVVELRLPSVVATERAFQAPTKRASRVDFASPSALAHEAAIDAEQDRLLAALSAVSPTAVVRARLRKLLDAVAVEAPAADEAAIAALPGVVSVSRERTYQVLEAPADARQGLARTVSAPLAQDAGEGMKIAILDTGIDVTHPMFADNGFTAPPGFPRGAARHTNDKVIVAKSFVDSGTLEDESGHGTFVAGIAGGNADVPSPLGPLSGYAPRAFLGNYRVVDDRLAPEAGVAAALEEAVADGFDVANLSLGYTAGPTLGVLDRAVEAAVDAGIVVVAAAGNQGTSGAPGTVLSPASSPSAIAVAATSGHTWAGPYVRVTGPGPVPAELQAIAAGPATFGNGSMQWVTEPFAPLPLADVRAIAGSPNLCTRPPRGSLTGRIVVAENSPCLFFKMVKRAEAAGARAVIIYNSDPSDGGINRDFSGEQFFIIYVPKAKIPSVMVTRSAGIALLAWLEEHPEAEAGFEPLGRAPLIPGVVAFFSSRGPTRSNLLKPDVAAPGYGIYSAAPASVDASRFTAGYGTSYATPVVSASAALLRQRHPSWSVSDVKSALMTTASDALAFGVPADVAGPLRAGAGSVDVGRALETEVMASPTSVSFASAKLSRDVAAQAEIVLTNTGSLERTYTTEVRPVDGGSDLVATLGEASVTITAGATATLTLRVSASADAEAGDYTGFVILRDEGGAALRIPYWIRLVKK